MKLNATSLNNLSFQTNAFIIDSCTGEQNLFDSVSRPHAHQRLRVIPGSIRFSDASCYEHETSIAPVTLICYIWSNVYFDRLGIIQ